ncbi:MAG TPA: sigma-70 family RNA polymerase sigma factor [Clostridiaceae bacterium]|nr:sigma-70 family RNA polymerase sigma factor [Clostridiaceae bacterium]
MIDEKILKKAQEGDPSAVEKVCSATWEPLYRFVYSKVQNREEAEDITQETYVKSLSSLYKYNFEPENFSGFLKTVAMNVLRDRWRKNKRWKESAYIDEQKHIEAAYNDASETSANRILIEEALNRLSEEQRNIIILRIVKGYSVAETAQMTGKSQANVRVIQYRALKGLASILNDK